MFPLLLKRFTTIVGALALIAYIGIYANRLADAPIRSDGFSYYVYLPSWMLDGDVSLETVARDCCGGTFPDYTAIVRWPGTGRWVDAHPIGVAILQAPFFVAAHLLTRWSNLPPDGFSLYYQHAAGLAGLAYLLIGLALVRHLLSKHFTDGIVLATLVTLTFGTNLFHYGTFDSTFSHAYSFAAIAALLVVTEKWWNSAGRSAKASAERHVSLALGLVAAIFVLIRHPNALFLLLIPLYGVSSLDTARTRLMDLWTRRADVALVLAAFTIGISPQLAIYHHATGHWLVSSYGSLGRFDFASPHLFGVLFSVKKGLFFWSPALALAIAGMIAGTGWSRRWVLGAAIVLALDTYVIASWSDWQYGGSYGHRGFTDALAIFAIFIAAAYARVSRHPRLRWAVAAFATLAVALSVAQMILYWRGLIPFSDTTWTQYRAALGSLL
jgi:hypothetical protein